MRITLLRTVKGSRWRRGLVSAATLVLGVGLIGATGPAAAAPVHVDNPFLSAKGYVNPDWVASVNQEATNTGGTLGQQMATVATYSTAVWSTTYTFHVAARDAAANTSTASDAVTATTDAAPPPPSGELKAQYRNYHASAPGDNQAKPGLAVVNTGTADVDLSSLTVRYWFTRDAGASTFSTYCDYALRGCGDLTHSVVNLATPRTGADASLEVRYTAGAGALPAGASTGDAQLRFNKTDWSAFTESDDYFWSGTQTSYGDWIKITLYVNGALTWGTEP